MDAPSPVRHKRPIRPLSFPSHDPEWDMSESEPHGKLCWILYWLMRDAIGDAGKVGKDCFVYFDASKPARKCAPDVFVKLGKPHYEVDSWKTWVDGVPELAIEVLSPSDTEEKLTLPQKLERFHTMGIREVIAFNRDENEGQRLSAWDLIEGDLVERSIEHDSTPCLTLGLHFVVMPADGFAPALRLAHDARGESLLPTLRERYEAALRERDALMTSHEAALRERDALMTSHEAALRERDAARLHARELERQLDALRAAKK